MAVIGLEIGPIEPIRPITHQLNVAVVGNFEPVFHFVVNIRQRSDWNSVCNSIFLRKTSSVDQATGGLHIAQCETKVNA